MADEYVEIKDEDKTPFIIVTGFLGAGKTTFVNYILKEQKDMRLAVIENEFGEINIDEKLVSENMAQKEDLITMDNGCACCSLRGDLVRTLSTLVDRRKEFEAVLLETTGVADPAPIINTFNTNQWIADNFKIDSVLCLADAKHIKQHLDQERPDNAVNEAVQQVAFSDRILLNKTDLVTPEELDAVEDTLQSINHFAEVIRSTYSKVDIKRVLGLNSFNIDACLTIDPELLNEDDEDEDEAHGHAGAEHSSEGNEHGHASAEHGHASADHGHAAAEHGHDEENCTLDHDHASAPEHASSGHDHGHGHDNAAGAEEPKKKKRKKKIHDLSLVGSVGFSIPGNFDVQKFNMFMAALLQERAADIYRSKGVLSFAGQGTTKFVFQGVHEQIDFGPSKTEWLPDEARVSKMVFIGRNLDRAELKGKLEECLVPDAV